MSLKFSIIIPCYNAEKWIKQCLLSALNQTYENVEVIFVDNESTDNSVRIAEQLKEENPDLILSSAPNLYPNCWDEARSEGFRLMSGDYVLVMGADDYLDLQFVDRCMKIFSKAPDKIQALQTPIRGIKENTGQIINEISHSYKTLSEFKKLCLSKCPVNTPTVIYKTNLYTNNQLVTQPEVYGGAADYDLYCKLADEGVFIYPFPQWVGFYYRWHEEQATWAVHKEERNYDKMIQDYWSAQWDV